MTHIKKMMGRSIVPNPKKAIGFLGTSNVHKRMFTDKDGDGVKNVYDCQPNNKHKQGLLDEIKERINIRKVPKEETEARRVQKDAQQSRIRAIETEERVKTEEFRIRQKGKQKREFIQKGGTFGAISRGFQGTAREVGKLAGRTGQTKGKKKFKTVFVKKGKHFVKRRVAVKSGNATQREPIEREQTNRKPPQQPRSFMDINIPI